MIHCYTDGATALLFIDLETGTYDHYKVQDLAPERVEDQMQKALEEKIFLAHPEYREPYDRLIATSVFCRCGSFAYEYTSGRLACAECGERRPIEDYPTLLVPEILAGRVKKAEYEPVADPEPDVRDHPESAQGPEEV